MCSLQSEASPSDKAVPNSKHSWTTSCMKISERMQTCHLDKTTKLMTPGVCCSKIGITST